MTLKHLNVPTVCLLSSGESWPGSEALAVTKLNPEYCQVVEFLDQRSAMLILNQSLLIKHPVTLNIQVCYLWHQRSIEIFRSHIFWLWYISFLGVPCSCCPTSHPSGRLSSLFKSRTRWSFLCLDSIKLWVQTIHWRISNSFLLWAKGITSKRA